MSTDITYSSVTINIPMSDACGGCRELRFINEKF